MTEDLTLPQRVVSPRWRSVAVVLASLLVVSWAFLGYFVVDGGVSLNYCRVEQLDQKHDIMFLAEAARGRLSSRVFLAVQRRMSPELPERLEPDNTLRLQSVTLHFDPEGLLQGVSE